MECEIKYLMVLWSSSQEAQEAKKNPSLNSVKSATFIVIFLKKQFENTVFVCYFVIVLPKERLGKFSIQVVFLQFYAPFS